MYVTFYVIMLHNYMYYKTTNFKNMEIIKMSKTVNKNKNISFREYHIVSFVTGLYRVAKAD